MSHEERDDDRGGRDHQPRQNDQDNTPSRRLVRWREKPYAAVTESASESTTVPTVMSVELQEEHAEPVLVPGVRVVAGRERVRDEDRREDVVAAAERTGEHPRQRDEVDGADEQADQRGRRSAPSRAAKRARDALGPRVAAARSTGAPLGHHASRSPWIRPRSERGDRREHHDHERDRRRVPVGADREGLLVEVRREHLGAVARPAVREHVDELEDLPAADQVEHDDDRDHRAACTGR